MKEWALRSFASVEFKAREYIFNMVINLPAVSCQLAPGLLRHMVLWKNLTCLQACLMQQVHLELQFLFPAIYLTPACWKVLAAITVAILLRSRPFKRNTE